MGRLGSRMFDYERIECKIYGRIGCHISKQIVWPCRKLGIILFTIKKLDANFSAISGQAVKQLFWLWEGCEAVNLFMRRL